MPERVRRRRHRAVPRAPRRRTKFNYLVGRAGSSSVASCRSPRCSSTSYDRLKTVTRGYGSFDYEMLDYRETDIVKVDILVNSRARRRPLAARPPRIQGARRAALHYCDRLARTRSRASSSRSRSRGRHRREDHHRGQTISAYRKDVTAKCYGGDISRKRKLHREAEARARRSMKMVGNVADPSVGLRGRPQDGDEDE